MSKIILIYANCLNKTAKGDFSFAGSIAKDLVTEITQQGQDLDVVLTSTLDGMARFEQLYGSPVEGRVSIDGVCVGICALELFDAVKDDVIAFVESNRCKYAAADIVKRVISPESKFLFIGGAHQPIIDCPLKQLFQLMIYQDQQPGLYKHFDEDDVIMGSSGIGSRRLGLPEIKAVGDLPELTIEQRQQIPNACYGFMYLAAVDEPAELRTIRQYVAITGLSRYVIFYSSGLLLEMLTSLFFSPTYRLNLINK